MKYIFTFFFLLSSSFFSYSQSLTQNVRGKIIDLDSKSPLPGATVAIINDSSILNGVTSDINGFFELSKVPIGRQTIRVSFIGYKQQILTLNASSGKEVIINIELEESPTQLNAIEIEAHGKETSINEMAIVSTRTFAIEETERYAGSRGDPARMASSFAGVQGANDSRNDIVVRGNSPMGILWRLEGVDIPNPNHFAITGTTGGPVSILNNKMLSNSDFMTGAFPAEYGNGIAGVFDLRMRSGNNNKNEFTGQFGFLGTEFTAEGPLSRTKGSSFLVNYRYSTLKMFESLNIKIGTSAVPNYQDGAFKFNFPTSKGALSFFGIGGKSNIDILVSTYTEPQEEIYGDKNRDQYFGSSMGVIGASYIHQYNSSTFSKFTIATSLNESHSRHLLVLRDSSFKIDSLIPKLGYKAAENKSTVSYTISKKVNNRHSYKTGVVTDLYRFNMSDSLYNENNFSFENRLNYKGNTSLARVFFQWKYKISNAITFHNGLYSQYLFLNGSKSFEPRSSIRWQINEKNTLSGGVGIHSQMQPTYIYFHQKENNQGIFIQHNKKLGFTRSNHFILTYDYNLGKGLRLKTEAYYQQLRDVPIELKSSAFSIMNQGIGFTRFFPDNLINRGAGKNYGVEFTFEKFFSNTYFILATVSFYESKYFGSDEIERDTDFNGNFASNILFGKDFKLGENNTIGISTKCTWAGGRRYSPIHIDSSASKGEAVYIDKLTNTLQLKNYFRTDLRVTYKINKNRLSHEIALDLVNLLNTKNVLSMSYAPNAFSPDSDPIREEYQLGFLPLFYYKIDF